MLLMYNYTAERFNLLLNLVNSYKETLQIDLIWNSGAEVLCKKCYQRQSQIKSIAFNHQTPIRHNVSFILKTVGSQPRVKA